MPLYELSKLSIKALPETSFTLAGIHERHDLQRLLRETIDVISPETLIIAEEFGEWEDSKRRIDLLGVDKRANLVVIELKRTEDGGHMELQALRYAAMISTMTFKNAIGVFERYLSTRGEDALTARERLLKFLVWDDTADENKFAKDVRIVLASAEFSKEITSAVLWMNERNIDIRCVRLKPYSIDHASPVDT